MLAALRSGAFELHIIYVMSFNSWCFNANSLMISLAKIPKVEIDEELGKPIVSKEESFTLKIGHCPISSTFALFDKLV